MEARRLYTLWTENNGGLMKGGYGFLSPQAKSEIEFYAKYLTALEEFIEEITSATGKYTYLDGDAIVLDARNVLESYKGVS